MQAGILTTEPCFTTRMLQLWKKPRVLQCRRGVVIIGGQPIAHAIKNTRFIHLNAFVVLAIQTVRAEFPSFEPWQAFSVFALRNRGEASDNLNVRLSRLASICRANPTKLQMQYFKVLPAAIVAFEKLEATEKPKAHIQSFDFWKEALTGGCAPQHDELRTAVARLGAFTGCATSAIERTLTLQDWFWPKRQNHFHEQTELSEIFIASSSRTSDETTIAMARDIWKMVYGRPRKRKQER